MERELAHTNRGRHLHSRGQAEAGGRAYPAHKVNINLGGILLELQEHLVDVLIAGEPDHDLQLLHLDVYGVIVLAEEHLQPCRSDCEPLYMEKIPCSRGPLVIGGFFPAPVFSVNVNLSSANPQKFAGPGRQVGSLQFGGDRVVLNSFGGPGSAQTCEGGKNSMCHLNATNFVDPGST